MVVTELMNEPMQQSVSTLVFTSRIYDHKKIRKKLPDAVLVCVMRRPWRYTPRDIIILKELGPPEKLLNYVQEHLDADGQDLVNLQAYYSVKYFEHLTTDAEREIAELANLLDHNEKVVLLCREKPGEFCHRHLLRFFMVDDWDYLNGGEIIV